MQVDAIGECRKVLRGRLRLLTPVSMSRGQKNVPYSMGQIVLIISSEAIVVTSNGCAWLLTRVSLAVKVAE